MRRALPAGDATPASARISPFALLVALWLSIQLCGRWLAWTLFHGHGVYGWSRPGAWELARLLLATCLPALLAAVCLDGLSRLAPERRRGLARALLAFALLAWAEFDSAWLQMSRSHIGWRDVHMFLTEDWAEHFGLRTSDIVRQATVLAVHAAAIVAFALISGRLEQGRARLPSVPLMPALALVPLVVVADTALVAGPIHERREQWLELLALHPPRLDVLDGWWSAAEDPDLVAARAELERLRDAPPISAPPPPLRATLDDVRDVVVIMIESWNPDYVDERTMPFVTSLRSRGFELGRHASTGNCTHYGVLGLLYGEPVWFYRGPEAAPRAGSRAGSDSPATFPWCGSPWIDAFAEAGFVTRYLGSALTSFRHMGAYMTNFAKPHVETDVDALPAALAEELAAEARSFVLLFYGATHFPWPHEAAFSAFAPETPSEFDYNAWDVRDHAEANKNRYRNALAQLDRWLEGVFALLDTESTLVLLVGDHGQEFFERGRLAHGSALDEPQLRTFALFAGPGIPVGTTEARTSHADLMPTIADWVGLRRPLGAPPESIVAGRPLPLDPPLVEPGYAIAAHNEHTRAPRRWAVLTEREKALLEGARRLRLDGLVDEQDRPAAYPADPARFARALRGAVDLERALETGHLEHVLETGR